MRALLAAAAAAVVTAAAPGAAQSQDLFGFAQDEIGDVVSTRVVDFRATGSLGVTWESDPATCAAVGRCGLDGTTTFHLPRSGELFVATTESAGRRRRFVYLSLADFDRPAAADAAVKARVRRAAAGGVRVCADAAQRPTFAALPVRAGRVSLGIVSGAPSDFLATRCAGPALSDVAPAIPELAVPFSRIARGRSFVRLQGDGAFAAGGLRGRAVSSLALRLGRSRDPGDGGPVASRGRRVREITVEYRIAEVRGAVDADLAGAEDPAECGPLDSCGLTGTLRMLPAVRRGLVIVSATVAFSQGRRAARRAVGLLPGGAPAGAETFGFGLIEGPGRVEASLGRPGEDACTDTAPLTESALSFVFSRASIEVTYEVARARTRCPGPLPLLAPKVARAELPLAALGARRVEVPLTRPATLLDHGWTGATRPGLTVVLERRRVLESVRRESF